MLVWTFEAHGMLTEAEGDRLVLSGKTRKEMAEYRPSESLRVWWRHHRGALFQINANETSCFDVKTTAKEPVTLEVRSKQLTILMLNDQNKLLEDVVEVEPLRELDGSLDNS